MAERRHCLGLDAGLAFGDDVESIGEHRHDGGRGDGRGRLGQARQTIDSNPGWQAGLVERRRRRSDQPGP
jgi:hypothetical protein